MIKKQEQLERDIEEIKENIESINRELLTKQELLLKSKEYVDMPILRNFRKGDIQDHFKVSTECANNIYVGLQDRFVRFWLKTGKLTIKRKRRSKK